MQNLRRLCWQLPLVGMLFVATLAMAEPVSAPDYEFVRQEVWIAMPDGVRLAADLYVPGTLSNANEKFPVLLEYDPYRKDDSRAGRYALYAYLAKRGYIVARVDIRGTGRSEGRLVPYEYSDQELDDGEVIIDWLSKLERSNGNVGMFGISWSGFNSIQLAARNPPALKAIVAVDATEDLYQDDSHSMDGVIHFDDWEMLQDLYNMLPPAPDYVIDDAYYANRFETEPWLLTWKKQQRDGPFWDRESARGKLQQIRIPSMHVGGWYDGYRDSLPRMLQNVRGPVKAIIGPWSHTWPSDPYPEPGFEWRHEVVRWFDHWLKGRDTGIMEEPALAVYVRNWHPPGPYLEYAPGRWRYEDGWPIERITPQAFYPQANHGLSKKPAANAKHLLGYFASNGVEASGPVMWWGDVAHDQRPTDAYSLVYDSEPLAADMEILGLPRALLTVSADAPRANWFVRLSDVAPDGTVTMVTGAGFNGTHRNSARAPVDIIPGELFPIDIEMHFTSWVFPKGHRIRIAISNAQWPMHWPTPYRMTTTLQLGGRDGSHVLLPVVPPGKERVPDFLPVVENDELAGYESLHVATASGWGELETVERNLQNGDATATASNSSGTRYPWGIELFRERIQHKTSDQHPEKSEVRGSHELEIQLTDRVLLLQGETTMSSDVENFYFEYSRRLSENGIVLREKTWSETIPRDYQ